MKILILSCNTGQGHNAAGKAVEEEWKRRGVCCEMKDVMAFAGRETSRRVEDIYVKITTKTPWLFQGAYKAGELISSSKRKSPVYWANIHYARSLYDYIERECIDGVIMPHLFPAEAMTYIRRHFDTGARCYGIATDYTCIPFWEETELDYYFVPPLEAGKSFREKGIPGEKLVETGIPVSAVFSKRLDQREARSLLGLPMKGFVFLIMTGSMGYGHTADLVDAFLERGGGSTVAVMTGHNESLRAELEKKSYDPARVIILPYTDQVSLYMDACDVLLTKPGGLTTTEAAVKRIAMVHTKPIPGCETINARFFSKYGMSICADTAKEAAAQAFDLAENPDKREAMKKKQEQWIPETAAQSICDFIVRDLENGL